MNCCATDGTPREKEPEPRRAHVDITNLEATESFTERCPLCQSSGRPVSRKTVLLMINSDLLDEGMRGIYRFCPESECSVFYFDEQSSRVFNTSDLRGSATGRATENTMPLCYCFGFDESHIISEIFRTGKSTVPERISRLIREGLCACESRNPSGVCCLGEVNTAVKRHIESIQLHRDHT